MAPKHRYLIPDAERKNIRRKRPPSRKVPESKEDRPLTRKQELFVKILCSSDGQITLREAARQAGYGEKSSHVRASELTNPNLYPHVCKAIRVYRNELDEKYAVNYKNHIRTLATIRNQAIEDKAYSAAVQAEYRRGQARGDIYVNRSEIRHGTIDQMNVEDVKKALNEIRSTYDRAPRETSPSVRKSRGQFLEVVESPTEEKTAEVAGDQD